MALTGKVAFPIYIAQHCQVAEVVKGNVGALKPCALARKSYIILEHF